MRAGLLAAVGATALAWAAVAQAAVTVNVVSNGVPVPGQSVNLKDANGGFADFGTTNAAGQVVFSGVNPATEPAPYTADVEVRDNCRDFSDASRAASAPGLADGATTTLTVDATVFCGDSFPDSSLPAATGAVDAASRRVLALPGGTADLDLLLPFGASNVVVSAGATPLNAPATGDKVRITAPAGGYEGPLTLSYTYGGANGSYALGTMVSKAIGPPVRLPGPIDIEAIVDISGSMGGTDSKFIRKDAMSLLADLVRPGDKLGAVGFDDKYQPIFPLTTITGVPAVANSLKAAARKAIINRGSTDYNVGMSQAYAALTTTPGVDPNRQKGVIFLTDGGHNAGAYGNGHLLFALNSSGRSWPVCAVQLGPKAAFAAGDVARLKRIASETGGSYFATDKASDLTDIYNRCFNLSTGQKTLANRVFTFKAGQARTYRQTLPRGLSQATFFANWGSGAYNLILTDPRGRLHSSKAPGKGFAFRRGATFAFFRVTKPLSGRWTIQLKNLRLPGGTDRARSNITTPRR